MEDYFARMIFGGGRRKKAKKPKKKKADNWFETCTVAQLKELCKACTLPVSGTKGVLCDKLLSHDVAERYGEARQVYLKVLCKDKLLVQSGNKFDQVLRLLHNEYGTGSAKRAATEIDSATGKEVIKRRKITPSAKMMYTRVEKKMKAVSQKKYQSYYGSKSHSTDVYNMMKDLINEHCIDSNIVNSDPMLALEMSTAVFKAFNDNWQVMERPGYETVVFREALDKFASILKVAQSSMNKGQVENVVSLLESIEVCVKGYGLHERSEFDANVHYTTGRGKDDTTFMMFNKANYKVPCHAGENVIQQTILVIMPDYDKSTREEKTSKILDCDAFGMASMVMSRSIVGRE